MTDRKSLAREIFDLIEAHQLRHEPITLSSIERLVEEAGQSRASVGSTIASTRDLPVVEWVPAGESVRWNDEVVVMIWDEGDKITFINKDDPRHPYYAQTN